MSDYETLRMLANSQAARYPAVIEKNLKGEYGFFCGAIPTELADKRYKVAGDAVYDLLRSDAVKQGKITCFQVEEDGHLSRPYRKVSADKWVKDDGKSLSVAKIA
ncbi:hypothetical protein LCGC14_1156850 [marine sediment metagenome]|uniref:Uncharacterized protein n=1 Tax=marine sediment metagenome TaxID=412755 RepID=A0A0F9LYR4_9ZZZZ